MNTKDTKIEKQTKKIIAEIQQKLDNIEGYMVWLIAAGQRFRKDQRVEFSKRAIRRHLVPSTRADVRGTIKSIKGFSVVVALDDRKHPRSYHHAFFNPVFGPKLF